MEIRSLFFLGIIFFAFTCCVSADYRSSSGRSTITGRYVLIGSPSTTMNIVKLKNGFRIELEGGVDDSKSAVTPADCIVHAYGVLYGRTIEATFEAVETDTFSYPSDQAKTENRRIQIEFSRNKVKVIRVDSLGYCGYGAEFEGTYKRGK